MSRSRPLAESALPPVGSARRHTCTVHGKCVELWELDASFAGVARRLVRLGAEGVGGFESYGEDERGVFLVRRIATETVHSMARGERLEGLAALSKVRDVARALAACEKGGVFPGPLRPADVALASGDRTDAFVLADEWVRALLGAGRTAGSTGPSPRWTPPEQATGAPWDNAANRYVLGLVAYRWIAGVHPASGMGLRGALDAQRSAPPPFEEDLAASLRPGIQSLVLSMLDPDPGRRPTDASAIVHRCEALLRGDASHAGPPERPAPTLATVFHGDGPGRAAVKGPRTFHPLVPIGLGALVLGIGLIGARGAPAEPGAKPPLVIASARPLERANTAACAACHPRQVAEWERSVMAHAAKSPLFGALESLIEEQVGKDERCPNGAGVLRKRGADACREERSGLALTGAGGEHWCVNCHAAGDNLKDTVPAWAALGPAAARRPLRDVLEPAAMEGISCAVCHQTIGPVHAGTAYQGNPTWASPVTGAVFRVRPEDGLGIAGISNSGYLLEPSSFLGSGEPIVHRRATAEARRHLASSEACGACHDVRLFGTDTLGVRDRGEHFKRLRNAYSEWRSWADTEKAAGRRAASCQDCHMSLYPGVCVDDAKASTARAGSGDADRTGCPPGMRFEARAPGERARGLVATSSKAESTIASHFFTSVDLPLSPDFARRWADDLAVDASGLPLGLEARRAQLLRHTFRFEVATPVRVGPRRRS